MVSMSMGRFIVFEGVEGVGKSTQILAVAQWLSDQKISCEVTREPGGTPLAEEIRSLVLVQREEDMCPKTELLLMMAARMQHWYGRIQPLLDRGVWVLCDRFIDSSVAYQGAGRGLSESMIRELHQVLSPTMVPDVVFLLDMSVESSFERVQLRGEASDRMEGASRDFFIRARRCFLDAAALAPLRYSIIDAAQEQDQVSQCIIQECQKRFAIAQ